jgi:predicted Fe-Mo cluster-binding NifX family protein
MKKMKIVFTTSGDNINAALDSRFGRAARFILYDMERDTWELVDNEKNLDAAQGAGIQAAETVARLGASGVVTGHCGPKAFRVLSAAGVKIYNTDAPTVAEALDRFRSGKLVPAESADVEGHTV